MDHFCPIFFPLGGLEIISFIFYCLSGYFYFFSMPIEICVNLWTSKINFYILPYQKGKILAHYYFLFLSLLFMLSHLRVWFFNFVNYYIFQLIYKFYYVLYLLLLSLYFMYILSWVMYSFSVKHPWTNQLYRR